MTYCMSWTSLIKMLSCELCQFSPTTTRPRLPATPIIILWQWMLDATYLFVPTCSDSFIQHSFFSETVLLSGCFFHDIENIRWIVSDIWPNVTISPLDFLWQLTCFSNAMSVHSCENGFSVRLTAWFPLIKSSCTTRWISARWCMSASYTGPRQHAVAEKFFMTVIFKTH